MATAGKTLRLAFASLLSLGLIGGHGLTGVARAADPQSRLLHGPSTGGRKSALPDILMDVEKQQSVLDARKSAVPVEQQGTLLPNRVYLHHFYVDNKWYFVLTNFEGNYPKEPLEFIRIGSVLSGRYLGAKNPEQRYLLNRQALWVPTYRPEAHYFWLQDRVPRIKQVEFASLIELPGQQQPEKNTSGEKK